MPRSCCGAAASQGGELHVSIDAAFKHSLSLGPREGHEIAASSNGLTILFDRDSAQRANGLVIGAAESGGRKALTVENPNAPRAAAVNQLSAQELQSLMESGQAFHLYDVRTPEEHRQARIAGATLIDPRVAAEIEKLPKDALIIFHCHHGGRSQAAAEPSRAGSRTLLAGGIDAWSREVDPSVPRY
jgi:monothiol glutaredoxin